MLVAQPATAGPKPGTNPKQYVASISVVPVPLSTTVTITVTFTNMPGSAALGSAQVTVPPDFTGVTLTNPAISAVSANKKWKASKPANSNVISLTALSDTQKIQPGQFVSVRFTATPPSATSGEGDIFFTQAKTSTNFTGVSFLTNIGVDPVVTICTTGSCETQFGNPNNPPRDIQTAQVTLGDGCTGSCIVTLGGTAGDFCSTSPNPPATPCRTHVGPDLKIDGYSGEVTEILSCNGLDCPLPPGGGGTLPADFYPVWIDKNDGTTMTTDTVLQVVDFCGEEVPTPCLESDGTGRFYIGDSGDTYYQSTIDMTFPFDPKTLH